MEELRFVVSYAMHALTVLVVRFVDGGFPGWVECELKRYRDENGRELVRVSTARPDSIESTGGITEFTVPAVLITALDD